MNHPKSEQTIIRHKYSFDVFEKNTNGVIENQKVKYINDLGKPCFYRVIKNDVDTLERVQYYGGRLLQVVSVAKQPL